jgi:hypothetical protein
MYVVTTPRRSKTGVELTKSVGVREAAARPRKLMGDAPRRGLRLPALMVLWCDPLAIAQTVATSARR